MIDLSVSELELVKQLLRQHVPVCEVRAFGSRVNGCAKPYSDLDLVIFGTEKLSPDLLSDLKEAFVESDLPFRVDLLDWTQLSTEFRAVINRNYVILQEQA